jgi:curli biogenesis system outer membrane secretion channel CsgG
MSAVTFLARGLVIVAGVTLVSGAGLFNNKTRKGEGGTDVSDIAKCSKPIGTAALHEHPYSGYSYYGLSSPIPMVKVMMQKSGCFRIVNRGQGSSALKAERALADSGEFQKGSDMGKGQMAAADYVIVPQVVHKDANSGGGGAGLGGLLPGRLGAIAGGFRKKNREAQVVLSLTNVRTSIEEAIVEGSAKKSDLSVAGFGWLGVVAGGGGAYEDTDIGKLVIVAFVDAHNKLVAELGSITEDAAGADNAGWMTAAQVQFRAGPSKNAPSLSTLYKETSVMATGNTNGDWWEVEALGKTGWVHSDYLTR